MLKIIKKTTSEEIDAAVAESLGWVKHSTAGSVSTSPWQSPNNIYHQHPPRFATSLDVCRVFEEKAPSGYWRKLAELKNTSIFKQTEASALDFEIPMGAGHVLLATARERCKAWLEWLDHDAFVKRSDAAYAEHRRNSGGAQHRCATCDQWYNDYDADAAVHQHPEPQSGPPRASWLASKLSYADWIEFTPAGTRWAAERKRLAAGTKAK